MIMSINMLYYDEKYYPVWSCDTCFEVIEDSERAYVITPQTHHQNSTLPICVLCSGCYYKGTPPIDGVELVKAGRRTVCLNHFVDLLTTNSKDWQPAKKPDTEATP